MRWIVVSALLATAVVGAWIGMDVARSCVHNGTDNDTTERLLAIAGAIAVGVATGFAVRVHWLLRAVLVVLATGLTFGGIVVLEGFSWLNECD